MPTVDLFDLPAFDPKHRGGPRECADKLMSEAAEVFAEVRCLDEVRDNGGSADPYRRFVALEIADVLQVCRNICRVCKIDPDMMAEAMRECYEKNNEKDGGRYW